MLVIVVDVLVVVVLRELVRWEVDRAEVVDERSEGMWLDVVDVVQGRVRTE